MMFPDRLLDDDAVKKYLVQYFFNGVIAARPGLAHDPYEAADEAMRRLEELNQKRLAKLKTKLKAGK